MTTDRLDPAYRERWIRSGGLGAVAVVPSFSPLEAYPAALRAIPAGTPSHPALIEPRRGDGEPNLNHVAYVGIARAYLEAALTVLRRRPDVYLDSVRRAVGTWSRPPTEYEFVEHLRSRLLLWDRLHSRFLLWAPPGPTGSGPTFVLLGAAVLCGIAVLARPPAERGRILCVLTLPVVTITVNLVSGTLVEFEENNRFRVEVEALMFALGAWGTIDLCRRWLSWLRPSSP